MKPAQIFSSLILASALLGCGSGSSSLSQTDRLSTKPTNVKVERRDIVGYELLDGEIYVPPTSEAVVRAPYSGPVQQVMTTVGQRVRRGEVLVQMSLPDQQQYYADAQATVKAAETAYANALDTYNSSVRQAEQALATARASERQFREQTDPNGDASGLVQARQAREQAEQLVMQTKAEARANIQPYKDQLDQARAALKAGKAGVKQGSITAPISGTVLEVGVSAGQQVNGTAPIVHIVDLGDIKINCDLTRDEAGLIEEGKEVVVTFIGLEDKPFTGRVSAVRTIPEAGGVKKMATVDFKNDDGLVKPATKVKSVGVKIGEAKDVLTVPADAVYQDPTGKPVVNLLSGSDWMPTVVETGLTDGVYTEVKKGLKEGDTVQTPGVAPQR